jgi:hypothetical protein
VRRRALPRPGPAFARFDKVANGGDEVPHRALKIWLKIAPADDAFLGVEVDQDERPAVEPAHLGDDWTL